MFMDVTSAARAAALWAGLHLLLLLVLAVLVSRQRRKHGVPIGDGGVPGLVRATRAFGNATEYVPTALAGLAILGMLSAPGLLVHALGGLLFIGRLLHALGLSVSTAATWPRAFGTLATWIAYLAAATVLLFYAIR
jgi:uncharacterized membrane protein YecN with MAPEG domain